MFSTATLLVAFASSYEEVLVLRVLTGAGEGVFVPVAAGLLAKFFANRRGLAMGFTLGVTSGDFMGGYLGSIYKTYTYNFIYSATWGFLITAASFLFLYSYRKEINSIYGKDVNKPSHSTAGAEPGKKCKAESHNKFPDIGPNCFRSYVIYEQLGIDGLYYLASLLPQHS